MMKSKKFFIVLICAASIYGCGGGQEGKGNVGPAPLVYSVTGRVSNTGGQPVANVNVVLNGTITSTTQTDAAGNYLFTGLVSGKYVVKPSVTGYAFSPNSSKILHVIDKNIDAINFTAVNAAATYSIDGKVVSCNVGMPGVAVNLAGDNQGVMLTDASGEFHFTGLLSGNYTLLPTHAGYTFRTPSVAARILAQNATTQDVEVLTPSACRASGNVAYTGNKTGRIYVKLNYSTLGTSVAGPGPFSIRGVAPGTYSLHAYLDAIGDGIERITSPSADMAGFTVNGTSLSGLNLTLTDPVPPLSPPQTPQNVIVSPGDRAVLVSWSDQSVQNVQTTTGYRIDWGTTSSANSFTRIFLGNSAFLPLENGQYYFKVVSLVGTTESEPSPVIGPVTVGPAKDSGPYSVSGQIVGPSSASAIVYAFLLDLNGKFARSFIPARVEPQGGEYRYVFSGLASGNYQVYALVDNNSNGDFDEGDQVSERNKDAQTGFNVTQNVVRNITLDTRNVIASTYSTHQSNYGDEHFRMEFRLDAVTKFPVTVALSAPMLPMRDLALMTDTAFTWLDFGGQMPEPGETYVFNLAYRDGRTEALQLRAPAFLPLAQNLRVDTTNGRTHPIFKWDTPPTMGGMSPLTYTFNLIGGPAGDTVSIYQENIPVTQTSFSLSTPLKFGGQYNWGVQIEDAAGNSSWAHATVEYVP